MEKGDVVGELTLAAAIPQPMKDRNWPFSERYRPPWLWLVCNVSGCWPAVRFTVDEGSAIVCTIWP